MTDVGLRTEKTKMSISSC